MSHQLDSTNDVVSYADSRTDAWHRLGTPVGHSMTAREALTVAHLVGWNVRKMALSIPRQPVLTELGVTTPAPIPVPDMFATVRDNPIVPGRIDYLGVVGTKYEPVQNEASCTLLDAITDQSGAHYETAGALRDGRDTFITMKLPKTMTLHGRNGQTDRTDFYLAALNSHDGSAAFRVIVTPVRIVCANTQKAALAAARSSYAIRHTTGARAAITQARHALGLTWRYLEAFEAEAAALYAQDMHVDEMREFATTLVKADDPAASRTARTRRQQQANHIVKLFVSSPTVANVAGTRWAAYNAVSEYLDHHQPVRGARNHGDAVTARAIRAVTAGSAADTLKLQAFRLLQTT
ncbi:DUF932 domain-containing protein [Mycolicibacterium llatzerense]|uniref:DUF932 domain-containing protein n=1 Tax=Mycolicibacterium llatzerense TaxID=280871 RepID=UPI0008DC658E|nr:DUF932 domain-containing protein [Mycolicibacterium llatzerense]